MASIHLGKLASMDMKLIAIHGMDIFVVNGQDVKSKNTLAKSGSLWT